MLVRRTRAAAAGRTRLRCADRGQAGRRDRRHRPGSRPTPNSRGSPGQPRYPHPRGAPTATASTAAATANSTAHCTVSPSARAAWTPTPPPTSLANKPTARAAEKRCDVSNATSPATCGDFSSLHPCALQTINPDERRHHGPLQHAQQPLRLDIEATQCPSASGPRCSPTRGSPRPSSTAFPPRPHHRHRHRVLALPPRPQHHEAMTPASDLQAHLTSTSTSARRSHFRLSAPREN